MELGGAMRALDSEPKCLAQVLTRLGRGRGSRGEVGRGRRGFHRLAGEARGQLLKSHQEAVNEPGEDHRLQVRTGGQRRWELEWAGALRKASWRRSVKRVLKDW